MEILQDLLKRSITEKIRNDNLNIDEDLFLRSKACAKQLNSYTWLKKAGSYVRVRAWRVLGTALMASI